MAISIVLPLERVDNYTSMVHIERCPIYRASKNGYLPMADLFYVARFVVRSYLNSVKFHFIGRRANTCISLAEMILEAIAVFISGVIIAFAGMVTISYLSFWWWLRGRTIAAQFFGAHDEYQRRPSYSIAAKGD